MEYTREHLATLPLWRLEELLVTYRSLLDSNKADLDTLYYNCGDHLAEIVNLRNRTKDNPVLGQAYASLMGNTLDLAFSAAGEIVEEKAKIKPIRDQWREIAKATLIKRQDVRRRIREAKLEYPW